MLRDECQGCTYSLEGHYCYEVPCKECPLHSENPIRTERCGLTTCKCLTVPDGEKCPYRKEIDNEQ